MTTPDEFARFLSAPEGIRLEFKAATGGFHFDTLLKYIVALANEGGGKVILGVTDQRPRQVVGTAAFAEPGRTEAGIYERLHRRVPVEEQYYEGKRVVLVHVPSRPPGAAWSLDGTFWMRAGDNLEKMTDEQLRLIHLETGPDFSAEACPRARLSDLDGGALDDFRQRWAQRTGNERLRHRSDEQILADTELMVEGQLTFAALILFGTRAALGRFLGQAEVIFEYRSSEASGPAAERHEFREGLFLFHDHLWELVNKRNDRQHYQDGFFVIDIPTFDERSVREAVLNAVCHRDYHLGGSVFVRQFTRRIEVVSPGGLPLGVTPDNILEEQNPRNRRLAEVLGRCGLVERAGQGVNLMFEQAIRYSKPLPDWTGSATHKVCLTLQGTLRDPAFVRFLHQLGEDTLEQLTTQEFLVLDRVYHGQPIPPVLRANLVSLIEHRLLVEGKWDRPTSKELLLHRVRAQASTGSKLQELMSILPNRSRRQVQELLHELREAGLVHSRGSTRAARWYPGTGPGMT